MSTSYKLRRRYIYMLLTDGARQATRIVLVVMPVLTLFLGSTGPSDIYANRQQRFWLAICSPSKKNENWLQFLVSALILSFSLVAFRRRLFAHWHWVVLPLFIEWQKVPSPR